MLVGTTPIILDKRAVSPLKRKKSKNNGLSTGEKIKDAFYRVQPLYVR